MKKIIIFLKAFAPLIKKKIKIIYFSNLLALVLSNLFQIVSLSTIIPLFSILNNPENIKINKYLFYFYEKYNFNNYEDFIFSFALFTIILNIFSNFFINIFNIIQFFIIIKISKTIQNRLINLFFYASTKDLIQFKNSDNLSKIQLSNDILDKFLLPVSEMIGKIAFFLILSTILFFFSPIATASFIFLTLILVYLFNFILKKINKFTGKEIQNNFKKLILTINNGFKIITVIFLNNYQKFFTEKSDKINNNLIKFHTISYSISILPRILIESILIILIISLSLYYYKIQDENLFYYLLILGIIGYKIFPIFLHSYVYYNYVLSNIDTFSSLINDIKKKIIYFENSRYNSFKELKIKLNKIILGKNLILKRQNICLSTNKINFIYGKNGTGKSTIVNCLLGFYPKQCQILLDNKKIDKKNYYYYKNIIGYVPQKTELISDNMYNNITLGEEIEKKEFNNLLKICELKINNNTQKELKKILISENFSSISGGEAQKICIARALVKKPKILILDEATNQIDKQTENKILTNLISLNIMIIIITHRSKLFKNLSVQNFVIKNKKLIKNATQSDIR
jgi:ATP-binding cassette subfamily B protein